MLLVYVNGQLMRPGSDYTFNRLKPLPGFKFKIKHGTFVSLITHSFLWHSRRDYMVNVRKLTHEKGQEARIVTWVRV